MVTISGYTLRVLTQLQGHIGYISYQFSGVKHHHDFQIVS